MCHGPQKMVKQGSTLKIVKKKLIPKALDMIRKLADELLLATSWTTYSSCHRWQCP
jgi:hypothetical protein